jgi:hypothetical protein
MLPTRRSNALSDRRIRQIRTDGPYAFERVISIICPIFMVYIIVPSVKERREQLQKCIDSIYKNAGYPCVICIYENEPRGAIIAMHEMIEGINDIVWFIGCDTILTEKDTLKRLMEQYEDGLVLCPDDGIQHGRVITSPLCHSNLIKKYMCKDYFHNWADQEFTDIMNEKGIYKYCPEIKIEHNHWVNGKAPIDDAYKLAYQKDKEDKELYLKRNVKRTNQ